MKFPITIADGRTLQLDCAGVPNQILGLIESGKARFVLSLKELIEVTGRYNPFIQFHPINKKDGTPKSDVPEEVYMTYSWAGPNNNILLMNSPEDKARKRDGEAMVVYGSHYRKSAHRKYSRVTKVAFGKLQNYLYNWLEHQPHPVIVVPLVLFGGSNLQSIKLMVMPENCAPVAIASGLLQWFVTDPTLKLSDTERVGSVTVFAPPLQRAYFDNQQTVVHFRDGKMRVAFALTTYLGPTTKKEFFTQGLADERAVALHSAGVTFKVHDRTCTLLHGGPSGAGKSESLEASDGPVAKHSVRGDTIDFVLSKLVPYQKIGDDIMVASIERDESGELIVVARNGEGAAFIRTDQSTPENPYLAIEDLWDLIGDKPAACFNQVTTFGRGPAFHDRVFDSNGRQNPNGRVILRNTYDSTFDDGRHRVTHRTLGLRTGEDTAVFGFVAYMPFYPSALYWMTTLRDPKNPSINQRKLAANLLESEGPGSIAPFDLLDPGIRINKLVRFLAESDPTVFQALVPCQRVGLWEVGFSPVQLFRDYLRAGGELEVGDWAPNPLLGKLIAPYKDSLGNPLPAELFDTSKGLSPEDYQKGGGIIRDSMVHYLSVYVRSKKLHPVIREMFQGFIDGNDIRDLSAVFTADYVLSELAA